MNPDAPISNFRIFLNHGHRSIEVKGSDLNQVEALSTFAEKRLDTHTTYLGGIQANALLVFFSLVAYFVLTIAARKSKTKK